MKAFTEAITKIKEMRMDERFVPKGSLEWDQYQEALDYLEKRVHEIEERYRDALEERYSIQRAICGRERIR